MEEKITRKLTTILAADVEGYTRLMRADEEATLKTLGEYREIFDGLIARHVGRVFSTGGDSVLAEFGSAVEAVRCAISCQEEISSRNAELADERKLMFRIGINVGDVMVRDGDLFGDGVNVAARLEGLAEPGGVCISGSVFEQIKHKLSLGFEDMGQQEVKNIAEPVSAYRLVPGQVSDSMGATAAAKPSGARRWRMTAIAAAVVVIIIVAGGGLAVWRPWTPEIELASVELMAYPLPDKPSIAVLPFTNMSDDPNQEFFVDGLTEDLITDLSKVSGLFVIARNTVFTYKGKAVKVRRVAEELGVRYVLEGSVRRAGDQVRINVQLIDATTGGHLWADRYDGSLADIFALQDRVTTKIVGALAVKLSPSEELKLKARDTASLDAYDAYLLGSRHLNAIDRWRPDETRKARNAFEKAIALDPNFAAAHAGLAWTLWFQAEFGHNSGFEDFIAQKKKAIEMADKSLELSDNPLAHRLLAKQYLNMGYLTAQAVRLSVVPRHDEAVTEVRKAVALEPNNADSLAELSYYLVYAGNPDEAATLIRDAKRLNPNFPNWYHKPAGIAEYLSGRYEAAAEEFKAWFENDVIPFHSALWLAAAQAQTGNNPEAKAALQAALIGDRKYTTTSAVASYIPFKNQEHLDSLLDGLRKAGLPDAE